MELYGLGTIVTTVGLGVALLGAKYLSDVDKKVGRLENRISLIENPGIREDYKRDIREEIKELERKITIVDNPENVRIYREKIGEFKRDTLYENLEIIVPIGFGIGCIGVAGMFLGAYKDDRKF